jgi:hypothetical protein
MRGRAVCTPTSYLMWRRCGCEFRIREPKQNCRFPSFIRTSRTFHTNHHNTSCDMDIINILPSPPHFFRLFFRLAFSLFNSTVNANHRRAIVDRRSHFDFDIDGETGFFPRRPLPHLPQPFEIWEEAFAKAQKTLSLGEDDCEEAVEKRDLGEAWRSNIVMVSA